MSILVCGVGRETGTAFYFRDYLVISMKKIAWTVTCLLVLAIAAGVYLAGEKATLQKSTKRDTSVSKENTAQKVPAKPRILQAGPKIPLSDEEQASALAQGELISSLFEAAADQTPEKIESVYAALNHTDAEVREAAIDVIIQLIGRDGIPRLRAAMNSTDSITDKKKLADAIEFLELPTLSELRGRETTRPMSPKSPTNSAPPESTPQKDDSR